MKTITKLFNVAGCVALLCSPLSLAQSQPNFDQLIDGIWQYEMASSPFMAAEDDMPNAKQLLPDLSADTLKAGYQKWLSYDKKLAQIEPSSLTREQQITLLMQRYRIRNYLSEYEFNAHWMPITSEYGFHSSIAALPNQTLFSSAKDYSDYLVRLSNIPKYFKQNTDWMRKGVASGFTQPKIVLEGYEDSIASHIVTNPVDSVFYQPFISLPDYLSSQQKTALRAQAKTVISKHVVPAYQAVFDFMVDEYIPNARDTIGAKYWPDGKAYYANRAKHYTTTDLSPKAIHEIGLEEVARIRAEMEQIITQLGFEGSFADFIQFLRTDPQFYAKTPEELIKQASYIAKQMDAKLPALFETLPRTPYGVAPVPDSIAPKYTTGRYIGANNDTQPGYYWVNTYALDKRPLYALPALTLHEAVPGHHLQISLAKEMDDLPSVRRNTYISAFGEGWGLYSEFLGIEAGIYKTEYDHFGRLSYEMWRACRLVVDTGMHMFDWTRDEALAFMSQNTALSEHNIRTEVDRYISWPAQALSYKIGEIKIRQLRQQAEAQLGADFDIRAFHSAVLEHGSVPLFVLEENIQSFILSQEQQ